MQTSKDNIIHDCVMSTYRVDDREILHCFVGFIGADWDLVDVVQLIIDCDFSFYSRHPMADKSCLHVVKDGEIYVFDQVNQTE